MISSRISRRIKRLALLVLVSSGLQPAAAQQEIEVPGPYIHRFATAAFPVSVGEFKRWKVYRYDSEGRDISASYNLATPRGRILVTAYIFPARAAATPEEREGYCNETFEDSNQSITGRYADAKVDADGGALEMADVPPQLSRRRTYRLSTAFDGRQQPVRSEIHLYCYAGGDWLVKYRVSTPEGVETREAIRTFIRDGPWPGKGIVTLTGTSRTRPVGGQISS